MDYIVIGLGYGDEGKGLVTDYLASKNPKYTVVRYSGGQQAGHTVYYEDKMHVFANFGAGSFRGLPTYWSHKCTFDPIGTSNELEKLLAIGVEPKLCVNWNSPVTTPYDVAANIADRANMNHGSCGCGFGKTLQREEDHYHLQFEDLFHGRRILESKLEAIKLYYFSKSVSVEKEYLDKFYKSVDRIIDYPFIYRGDVFIDSPSECFSDEGYIFEGSQGLMLDQEIGLFPNVTRSNVGLKGIRGLSSSWSKSVFYVTRAYQNRHGNGHMSNNYIDFETLERKHETNLYNDRQGDFRVAVLDLDNIIYAISKDDPHHKTTRSLVITCLDHLYSYRLTHQDQLIEFKNEYQFIDYIAANVKYRFGIDKVYLSRSPYSKDLELFIKK